MKRDYGICPYCGHDEFEFIQLEDYPGSPLRMVQICKRCRGGIWEKRK